MTTRRIKLVIFDLDGTLVDAYKAVSSSLNYALGYFGFPLLEDQVIKRSVGWGEKALIEKFVPKSEVEKVLSVYRQHHRNALKTGTSFLPGARDLILDLKKDNYKLSIASNRPGRFTHIILKQLAITRQFESIFCGDMVNNPKPSADMLIRTLENLSLKPNEAVYVGDMSLDVETGHNANVRTVAVVTGSCTREELERMKPYAIIEKISDMTKVLLEMNNLADNNFS